MGRYKKIFLCILLLIFTNPALASQNTKIDKYKDYNSIPKELRNFQANTTLEEYIAVILMKLKKLPYDGTEISQTNTDKWLEKALLKQKKYQINQFIDYDLNLDGIVTIKELEEYHLKHQPHKIDDFIFERRINEYMKKDLNKDGYISYKEAGNIDKTHKEKTKLSEVYVLATALIKLDSTPSDPLTVNDIKSISKKAFSTIDLDNNSFLSKKEIDKFLKIIIKKRPQNFQKKFHNVKCEIEEFDPPKNFKVYATGALEGKKLYYTLRREGPHVEQVNVIVNEPNYPVALMLSSLEQTIWNISYTPETKIIAVVLGGTHSSINKSVVAGIDRSIPVLIINKSIFESPCKESWFIKNIYLLNPLARKLFNKSADMFYPLNDDHSVIIGKQDFDDKTIISSIENTLETHLLEHVGIAALEAAVKKGVLRKSTVQDKEQWIEKLFQSQKHEEDIPPMHDNENYLNVFSPNIDLDRTYTVLKEYKLPRGLNRYHVNFFVPKGTPVPKGEFGSSRIFDFNHMACIGHVCDNGMLHLDGMGKNYVGHVPVMSGN